MNSLSLTQSPSFSSPKPPLLTSSSSSSFTSLIALKSSNKLNLYQRKIRNGTCRAELSHDAPFAAAIGACMLSSLVLPVAGAPEEDGDSAIDSTDARFAVMSIISFIPYFNWLSWVFAWLDTGRRRYVVYSLVYLIPYIRSNLSLSPDESWLPIASIIFCIVHVQLEASIKNGDIQGFQLFSEAAKRVSSTTRRTDQPKGRNREPVNLPSADKESRNQIRDWGVPRDSSHNSEHLNEDRDSEQDRDEEERMKH